MNPVKNETLGTEALSRTAESVETFLRRTKKEKCLSYMDGQVRFRRDFLGLAHTEIVQDLREIQIWSNERIVVSRTTWTPYIVGRPRPSRTEFVVRCTYDAPEGEGQNASVWDYRDWRFYSDGGIRFKGQQQTDEPIERGPLSPGDREYEAEFKNVRDIISEAL